MEKRLAIAIAVLWALMMTLATAPAAAQQRLNAYLSQSARDNITQARAQKRVNTALRKLEHSNIPRPMLAQLMASEKAAPFLPRALPQLASLKDAHGIGDVVKRLTRGGQSGAYELAVAHAFRRSIKSVSTFVAGNEVDGLLRSGTIIESKSGRPSRPEHILVQARRRAAGGNKVVLALNYKPRKKVMRKLQKLNRELNGRLEVQYLPLNGSGYKVLVNGRRVEDPTNRRNMDGPTKFKPVKVPLSRAKPQNRARKQPRGRWGHWFKGKHRARSGKRGR